MTAARRRCRHRPAAALAGRLPAAVAVRLPLQGQPFGHAAAVTLRAHTCCTCSKLGGLLPPTRSSSREAVRRLRPSAVPPQPRALCGTAMADMEAKPAHRATKRRCTTDLQTKPALQSRVPAVLPPPGLADWAGQDGRELLSSVLSPLLRCLILPPTSDMESSSYKREEHHSSATTGEP